MGCLQMKNLCKRRRARDEHHELILEPGTQKRIPFGKLNSRLVLALCFSYLGDTDEIKDLMTILSKRTKEYFLKENQLQGFLTKGVITLLEEAKQNGMFEELTKYQ